MAGLIFGLPSCLPASTALLSPAMQDFLSLIMRHWNVIADTLHSGDVFLPLLLEDENGISHANDWAKGFLRGMELRRTDWAILMDDETED
jgi:uncharacterized protein